MYFFLHAFFFLHIHRIGHNYGVATHLKLMKNASKYAKELISENHRVMSIKTDIYYIIVIFLTNSDGFSDVRKYVSLFARLKSDYKIVYSLIDIYTF